MFKTLFRFTLIVVFIVAVASFYYGYRWGDPHIDTVGRRPVGTTGIAPEVDTTRARQAGAEIGEKVAVGANRAEHVLSEAALTAKIKSKMALDDTIKASHISVDTTGTSVTLNGTVRTSSEKARALQLARETDGVTSVTDHLRVVP